MFKPDLKFKNQEKPYLPFDYFTNDSAHIQNIMQSQVSLISIKEINNSVLQVGQITGQYVKPRSNTCETSENERIYSYFGDMLNQSYNQHRTIQPWRMLLDYNCSASIYSELNQWNR